MLCACPDVPGLTIARGLKATAADDDLRKKLILEAKFRPKIARQFRAELAMFKASVQDNGLPPILSPDPWREMFTDQYALTFATFADQTGLSGFEGQALESNLNRFSDIRAPVTAVQVVGTTEIAMGQAVMNAEVALREAGETITRGALALVGTNLLRTGLLARNTSIATTETQVPAEEAKGQTADVKQLSDKIWRTVGDERVRRHHADADFQLRKANEPFLVNGELLRWPGDTSLGASASNIINCRCTAEYK